MKKTGKKETLEVYVNYKGQMEHEYNLESTNDGSSISLIREGSDWADHVRGEVCCDCKELTGDQYVIRLYEESSTGDTSLVLNSAEIFELYVLLGALSSVNELDIEYRKSEIIRRIPAIIAKD